MTRLELAFFPIGIIVILAHLTRNLSALYYVLLGIVLSLFFILSLKYINVRKFQLISFSLFAALLYTIFSSLMAGSSESIEIGVARLFYLSPVIIYFFSRNFDSKEVAIFWKIISLFIVVSSGSILIQYFIGPISWFADHSERAGTDRFASLAGSLTVYGSLVGVAIFSSKLIFKSNVTQVIVVFLLCLGAILSLQKMALFSMALSFGFIWIAFRRGMSSISLILLFFAFAIVGVAIFFILMHYFSDHLSYVSLIFTADASQVGDVSVADSIVDRLTNLPFEAFSYWGYLKGLLGVGVFGGSGGLGYPELPMTHNLIAETYLIFGVFLGSLIVLIILKYLILSAKLLVSASHIRLKLASASFLIVVLTSLFSGGLFYQPVMGLIFWFSFSELYKLNPHVKI